MTYTVNKWGVGEAVSQVDLFAFIFFRCGWIGVKSPFDLSLKKTKEGKRGAW